MDGASGSSRSQPGVGHVSVSTSTNPTEWNITVKSLYDYDLEIGAAKTIFVEQYNQKSGHIVGKPISERLVHFLSTDPEVQLPAGGVRELMAEELLRAPNRVRVKKSDLERYGREFCSRLDGEALELPLSENDYFELLRASKVVRSKSLLDDSKSETVH